MKTEEGKAINENYANNQETEDNDAETMFVAGIMGECYLNYKDVPVSMKYVYIRPSDGAVFMGTLWIYYVRAEVIDNAVRWHGLYEGTLTLQHYA